MKPTSDQPAVLSVSQLTALVKGTLEQLFSDVWVSGEISEVSRPQSGHIYFTLKDEGAQIRGVLWRGAAQKIRFQLEEGQQVICRGGIDVYPPRGSYQLVVRQVEPQGQGALQIAFRQLQERLAKEGLFDPARKRLLPKFPRRVAFVTSPTGAAVRDFLEVAGRRFRGVEILVIPARVQGPGAAAEIALGIQTANRLAVPPDVLVVGRGGGSLEDLWCFNEEVVVRAIHASVIPVVSAVGHEIDVTLSDLVADVRALTPSEAAERVIPSADDLTHRLGVLQRRLTGALRGTVAGAKKHLAMLASRRVFRQPLGRIHDLSRRLDELETRASRASGQRRQQASQQIASLASRLESLSPLAVLGRGYSVTMRPDGSVLKDAQGVSRDEVIVSQLQQGRIVSRVVDST